ncbi:hypothetical protein QC762_0115810 [Podospora pseudocomata]|uniref:Uncharacterized protein n=1 Tax=Podospora pseudocomata TaxID=2093779 RepID=A0ABR0G5P9_9PEZI|nr:hypothetical protein QC762_0115810 [Podospora pseudocomata]
MLQSGKAHHKTFISMHQSDPCLHTCTDSCLLNIELCLTPYHRLDSTGFPARVVFVKQKICQDNIGRRLTPPTCTAFCTLPTAKAVVDR